MQPPEPLQYYDISKRDIFDSIIAIEFQVPSIDDNLREDIYQACKKDHTTPFAERLFQFSERIDDEKKVELIEKLTDAVANRRIHDGQDAREMGEQIVSVLDTYLETNNLGSKRSFQKTIERIFSPSDLKKLFKEIIIDVKAKLLKIYQWAKEDDMHIRGPNDQEELVLVGGLLYGLVNILKQVEDDWRNDVSEEKLMRDIERSLGITMIVLLRVTAYKMGKMPLEQLHYDWMYVSAHTKAEYNFAQTQKTVKDIFRTTRDYLMYA